jgi:hypothetical protein
MTEFWVSTGHHLTRRDAAGELVVTDELGHGLAGAARADAARRRLCGRARAARGAAARAASPGGAAEIAAIADADARENWTQMLALRDRLLAAGTVERAYRALVREGMAGVPPLFVDQLAALALRNALDGLRGSVDAARGGAFLRPAARLVPRRRAAAGERGGRRGRRARAHVPPLAAMFDGRPPVAELDVLTDETAPSYWSRSDAFAMAFNLTQSKSREALARAIEAWVGHLRWRRGPRRAAGEDRRRGLALVRGLDAEGTRIGNAIWRGETLDAETLGRVLALFRLSYRKTRPLRSAAGRSI